MISELTTPPSLTGIALPVTLKYFSLLSTCSVLFIGLSCHALLLVSFPSLHSSLSLSLSLLSTLSLASTVSSRIHSQIYSLVSVTARRFLFQPILSFIIYIWMQELPSINFSSTISDSSYLESPKGVISQIIFTSQASFLCFKWFM